MYKLKLYLKIHTVKWNGSSTQRKYKFKIIWKKSKKSISWFFHVDYDLINLIKSMPTLLGSSPLHTWHTHLHFFGYTTPNTRQSLNQLRDCLQYVSLSTSVPFDWSLNMTTHISAICWTAHTGYTSSHLTKYLTFIRMYCFDCINS